MPGCNLLGVSCTGIWRWTDWVNSHPATKLILKRDFNEVQASLEAIGLPKLEKNAPSLLDRVYGLQFEYTDLFDTSAAEEIWRHATGRSFDAARHRALVEYVIQPKFDAIEPDKAVTRRLYDELSRM